MVSFYISLSHRALDRARKASFDRERCALSGQDEGRNMNRNWTALILALACCLLIGVAAATAEEPAPPTEEAPPASEEAASASPEGAFTILDESCSSGHACAWTFVHFWEVKGESLCTGGPHPLGGLKYSAKNRCANKKIFLRLQGTTVQICANPGGDRTTTEFDEIYVGTEGSRC
jgi:hypothetical protein